MRGLVKWWIWVLVVLLNVLLFIGLAGLFTGGSGAAGGTILAAWCAASALACEIWGYLRWRAKTRARQHQAMIEALRMQGHSS